MVRLSDVGRSDTMRRLDVIGEDSAIPLLILLVITVDLVALWLILAK
jgi:hypothetical protein